MRSDQQKPPKHAVRLFKWICGDAAVEDWMGDLEEIFFHNLDQKGATRAKWIFWKQIISLTFSYALKKRKKDTKPHFSVSGPSWAMLNNYLKVAYRSLLSHKLFSTINVIGLAFGMTICLLALSMLATIDNFDEFHENKDHLFTIITRVEGPDGKMAFATTSKVVPEELKTFEQDIDQIIRLRRGLSGNVLLGRNKVELNGLFADPSALTAFSYPLSQGNKFTALTDPFSIVLTENAAMKLFNTTDVIGQFIELEYKGRFQVTGVFDELPKQSHLNFEALASFSSVNLLERDDVTTSAFFNDYEELFTYVMMKPGKSIEDLSPAMADISNKMISDFETFQLDYIPITEIAGGEELMRSAGPQFDELTMIFFTVITMLILLPACFNYANLSLARTLKRSKEIGLRKVVGGARKDIFIQFLFETFILVLIALVFATYLFTFVRTEFLAMVQGAEMLDLSLQLDTVLYFIGFAIFTALMAGIVPAAYFSGLRAIDSLKGTLKVGSLVKFNIRKVLIVGQFSLSLLFIFGVIAMTGQYRHTLNFDFGFDDQNKLVVELDDVDHELFKTEFERFSEVQSVGFCSSIPGTWGVSSTYLYRDTELDSMRVFQMFADNVYLNQLDFNILAGDVFDQNLNQQEEVQLIANQSLLDRLGLDLENALSVQVELNEGVKGRIIGVVADFNHQSVRDEIQPFFFRYQPERFAYANMEVATTDVFNLVDKMELEWKAIAKTDRFEFFFLDEKLDEMYDWLVGQIKIYGFLSFLAITISCLGMLGMVVFTMENRIKEIGIRKVLGADVSGLTVLLSKGFLKLMFIACVIALPLSYLFFNTLFGQILHYYKPIGALEIVSSVLILLILGGTSVISQTIKTAKINPVDNLKYE